MSASEMPPTLPPVVPLTCSCCGGEAHGRQWHNRDLGFGVCTRCSDWIGGRETAEYMVRGYGVRGEHYACGEIVANI